MKFKDVNIKIQRMYNEYYLYICYTLSEKKMKKYHLEFEKRIVMYRLTNRTKKAKRKIQFDYTLK